MGVVFAPVKPIRLVRGTRWQDQVQLIDETTRDPVDLSTVTAITLRIRANINAPIVMELGLGDGLTIANPMLGLIDIDVPSDRTLEFPEASNRRAKYGYDAILERGPGEYEPAVAGKITVLPSYARPWAAT